MVLKKSNCVLNSGDTQRVSDRRSTFIPSRWVRSLCGFPEYNQINCDLRGDKKCLVNKKDKFTTSMFNFFSEVLGLEEVNPNLGSVVLSMEKKKRWMLPEFLNYIKSLTQRNDARLVGSANICPSTLSWFEDMMSDNRVAIRYRPGTTSRYSWSMPWFFEDKTVTNHTDYQSQTKNFKNPTHCTKIYKAPHSRGLQRLDPGSKLVKNRNRKRTRKRREKKNTNQTQEQNANKAQFYERKCANNYEPGQAKFRLQVDIIGDIKCDSRSAYENTPIKRWTLRHYNQPRVALCKGKGSTKGRHYKYVQRRFFNSDLREEIHETNAAWMEGECNNIINSETDVCHQDIYSTTSDIEILKDSNYCDPYEKAYSNFNTTSTKSCAVSSRHFTLSDFWIVKTNDHKTEKGYEIERAGLYTKQDISSFKNVRGFHGISMNNNDEDHGYVADSHSSEVTSTNDRDNEEILWEEDWVIVSTGLR